MIIIYGHRTYGAVDEQGARDALFTGELHRRNIARCGIAQSSATRTLLRLTAVATSARASTVCVEPG